jgi:hypothetical protein
VTGPVYQIYCDKADDELFAHEVFREGPLANAEILRLPAHRSAAPAGLREFLEWERSDWLITRDGQLVAAAELSRHGYTGDNGFQRFARLQRAASLGVPGVYFTPFSRTRLNELDHGQNNPRNVAPEMFAALLQAGDEYDTPCLAVRWPTDEEGTPLPLGEEGARDAVNTLRGLMEGFATSKSRGSRAAYPWIPLGVVADMQTQASLPVTGGETRFSIDLPINVESDDWLWDALPPRYFSSGKTDKILAHMALASNSLRPLPAGTQTGFWANAGRAQVQYLGYQWRPDPACGLIAFSGVLARRAGLPLIVVWPRVFLANTAERSSLLASLHTFSDSGLGPIADSGRSLGFSGQSMDAFRERLNTDSKQFGLFAPKSKVGRILEANADLVVFGDALYLPR